MNETTWKSIGTGNPQITAHTKNQTHITLPQKVMEYLESTVETLVFDILVENLPQFYKSLVLKLSETWS